MENMEKLEQSVVLQVNGVTVDVGVITKDADFELNNNDTVESSEKLVKIPEENLSEKSSELSSDEQEKNAQQSSDENAIAADDGKMNDTISTSELLEGESKVEPNETNAEEKSDTCSTSSSSSVSASSSSSSTVAPADSETSPTLENTDTDKTENTDGSVVEELTVKDTVTNDSKGQADTNADTTTDTTTDTNTNVDENENANAEAEQQQQQQQNDTQQTAENIDQSKTESPSKKKASPKKRKNRSRSQKKPFDYSQLMNYTLGVTQRSRRYFLTVPRGQNVPAPTDDCEIFVSNIPINVLEEELLPLFEKFGKIWEMRLMMSMRNPKRNAGFAFVRYTADQSAKEAAEKLNNYEIVPGKLLSVRLSQPNLSLFVGNIHRGLTREQIHEKIGGKTQGLVKTFVKSSLYETTKNCGFCFLEYDCHSSALNAKRQLNRGNVWGRQLFVDWAQRRKPINENDQQSSKTLFINYLPKETTEQQIADTMSAYGTIEKVTKIKDYAFALFTEHQAAIDAMNGTDKTKLGSDTVEISLAMPKTMKQHRNRYPSFSYHRTRRNRGGNGGGGGNGNNHNYNHRYRSSYGSSGKFFMHKQQPKNQTNANQTNAMPTAGTSNDQTVIPSMVHQPPEQLIVS